MSAVRVALCHPVFWPEVRRGAERFTRELADALAPRGVRARIVTTHAGRPSRRVEDGIEVARAWRPPDGRLRRRLYEDWLTTIPGIYLELRRGDDDLAQAMHPTSALAAARWARRSGGRPVVLAYMGIPHRAALVNRRHRAEVLVEACRRSSAVTALSEHVRDAFHRWLGVEARVIPPPVDTRTFTPGGEREPEPTIVCAAAAAEPRKRVDLLVEAFARVRREHSGARLLLDRPRDPQLAARLEDPAGGVHLVPMDDRNALADLYRRAWVSTLPAWGEAFGLVLAEALACGTPVVGSAREGIPEVLGGDPAVGRTFEGDDPVALARALLEAVELARDPATRAACRRRGELFSAERCAAAYAELYAELLAAG